MRPPPSPTPPRPLDTKCVLCVLCARLALDPTFFADTTSARHTPDTCALGHASSLGPCTHASVTVPLLCDCVSSALRLLVIAPPLITLTVL